VDACFKVKYMCTWTLKQFNSVKLFNRQIKCTNLSGKKLKLLTCRQYQFLPIDQCFPGSNLWPHYRWLFLCWRPTLELWHRGRSMWRHLHMVRYVFVLLFMQIIVKYLYFMVLVQKLFTTNYNIEWLLVVNIISFLQWLYLYFRVIITWDLKNI